MAGRDPADVQPLEVKIERLAAGGDGVAHLPDGRIVFVPFSAPGDVARVKITEEQRRYARAEVLELVVRGEGRREPECAHYGRCGGCTWQHLAYESQLAAKQSILRDAVERIAHLKAPPIEMVPSPQPYGYRHRARIAVAKGGVGYRERSSHALCAIRDCPVLVPELREELARIAEARAGDSEVPLPQDLQIEEEWELVLGEGGRVRSTPHRPPAGGDLMQALDLRVAGDALRISPGVFAQANGPLLDTLSQAVCKAASAPHAAASARGDGESKRALELFAGAGFFTLGLARCFSELRAVESHPASVKDLRFNLERAGLQNVAVVKASAESLLSREVARSSSHPLDSSDKAPRYDVVVLDPPRTGLAKGGAGNLALLNAERIVYLSCDPATLARDLAQLCRGGYRLTRLTGFDLFPQTAHVEALAVLERELRAGIG